MDNPARRKTTEVARLIAEVGAEVRHLPACSPDPNPIERLLSKLKAWPRSAEAGTVDGLIGAMGDALRAVRAGDFWGWFGHSGYGAGPSTGTPNRNLLQLSGPHPGLLS